MMHNHKGFTMVEVIVAILILAIVIAGVFASFTAARNWANKNRSRLDALAVAEQVAHKLRYCVSADPTGAQAALYEYPPDIAGAQWGLDTGGSDADNAQEVHSFALNAAGEFTSPLATSSAPNYNAVCKYRVRNLPRIGTQVSPAKEVIIRVQWQQPTP